MSHANLYLVLVFVAFSSGCATKLTKAGEKVMVVDTGQLSLIRENCELLGKYRGKTSNDATRESALNNLKNLVGRDGGNVVVSNEKYKVTRLQGVASQVTVMGLAYDCPKRVLTKLIDTTGI